MSSPAATCTHRAHARKRPTPRRLRPWLVLIAGGFLIAIGAITCQLEEIVIGAACLGVFPVGR